MKDRSKGRVGWLAAAGAVVLAMAWASPAGAESVIETMQRSFQLHGYLENQEIIRNENYVSGYHVASIRNRMDLQLTGAIVRGLDMDVLGKSGSLEYFLELRPGYEGAYDILNDRFGDRPTGFSGMGNSPFQPPGPSLPGFGLLKAFGYKPKEFKFFGARNFSFPDPVAPNERFLRDCDHCVDVNISQKNLSFERYFSDWYYYPVREAYLDFRWKFLGTNALRIGRQQSVWGKADFFRLQDIANPIDFSQHFFIEPFEDTRVPELSAWWQHQIGDVGPVSDVAANVVWNFDHFVPVGLGQTGMPWSTQFGDESRAFAFNEGLFSDALCTPPACNSKVVHFGTSKEMLPNWRFSNTGIGGKLDFSIPEPQIRFALTDYWGIRDVPVFAIGDVNTTSAINPVCSSLATVTGTPTTLNNGLPIVVAKPNQIKLASGVRPDRFLDLCGFGSNSIIKFKKVNTLGFSADYFEAGSGTVIRLESSWTANAMVNNTNALDRTSQQDILAWVLGIDKQHFIKFLNPDRTFFSSFQIFETYYPGASSTDGGRRGIITGVNDFIFTAFTQTHYSRDRLIPLVFATFGTEGTDSTLGGNVEYLATDHWSATVGVDAFLGKTHLHDVGEYTAFNGGNPYSETIWGWAHEQAGGFERNKMDEFWTRIRYRF